MNETPEELLALVKRLRDASEYHGDHTASTTDDAADILERLSVELKAKDGDAAVARARAEAIVEESRCMDCGCRVCRPALVEAITAELLRAEVIVVAG